MIRNFSLYVFMYVVRQAIYRILNEFVKPELSLFLNLTIKSSTPGTTFDHARNNCNISTLG